MDKTRENALISRSSYFVVSECSIEQSQQRHHQTLDAAMMLRGYWVGSDDLSHLWSILSNSICRLLLMMIQWGTPCGPSSYVKMPAFNWDCWCLLVLFSSEVAEATFLGMPQSAHVSHWGWLLSVDRIMGSLEKTAGHVCRGF